MTHPLEGHSSPADSGGTSSTLTKRLAQGAGVIVVSSVMFRFISFWRAAAVVLCDLASTAYYIGAIVEQSIGPAAPWIILAVMCFSYAVRWVYIESCTLFVRGGAYRVVREAMGPLMAKVAVSALMFDYILTGPISSVTAGQYIMGLGVDLLNLFFSTKAADGVVVPKVSERRARSVAELRAGGVGVDRPLAVHVLDVVDAAAIAELAQRGLYDLIVLPLPAESASDPMGRLSEREKSIIQRAHCRVMLVSHPVIPDEVVDRTQAVSGT